MFGKRKRERRQYEADVQERAAKRAARGPRNPAVSQEFHNETEQMLDRLETLRTRSRNYRLPPYTLVLDSDGQSQTWGEGLQFARGHFTTQQEAKQVIDRIMAQAQNVIDRPFVEEQIILQWEAIVSERADRTKSLPQIAESMVGSLREAIVANVPCARPNMMYLRNAGKDVMTLVPYHEYPTLMPVAEMNLENAANRAMHGAGTPGALQRLARRMRTIAQDEEIDAEDICVVCQEGYVVGQAVIEMRCNHVFHDECVQDWVGQRTGECPVCRVAVSESSDEGAKVADPKAAAKAPYVQPLARTIEPEQSPARAWACNFCRTFLCFGSSDEESSSTQENSGSIEGSGS
ncbi:hypothetical protein N7492_002212 [Penicillium capsulatum]|uniref:RING-type domain-containing protein n=1 Tax=Penicillium capsulatum TaxID=69766 RepID=A0A9W9LW52_9EURO|nr:hypothetical protein N7492_002212 [Penicillium capsulatum]KAJ6123181.1 hypothetical protein N7512_005646 [Penicillium capsulatum]